MNIHVRVPASTANLGPGFDCLGLALSLHNEATFTFEGLKRTRSARHAPEVEVRIEGVGLEALPRKEKNLVWRAVERALSEIAASVEKATIHCKNRIPLNSGLGSSAAACVAGLAAANELCGNPLSREKLLCLAAEIEGHPDNAAPSILGGLTACYDADGTPKAISIPLRARISIVVCTPDVGVPTQEARKVLPRQIPFRDAAIAVGRAAAITGMLATGDLDGLREAMEDVLHEPYRSRLVPGMCDAMEAALDAGALGAALSGAGPTIVAFCPGEDRTTATRVGAALVKTFETCGHKAASRALRVDRSGVKVTQANG